MKMILVAALMPKFSHLKCCSLIFAPAIHLLSLKVASIFKQLNIIEEKADHSFCFLQICLHLCCVLSRSPWAQHHHVLQHRDKDVTALHVAAIISAEVVSVTKVCVSPSAAKSRPGWAAPHTPPTPSGPYWRPSEVAPACRRRKGRSKRQITLDKGDYLT